VLRPWITGPLELVTPAAGQVVSLAEARAQLLWDSDDATQDQRITAAILVATRMCEQEISGHRQFLTATYNLPLIVWPWTSILKLPRPPLRSVNAVTYYDTNGTLQTLAATYYLTQMPWRMPGQLERAPQQVFPPYQFDRRFPAAVNFSAGYASPTTVSGSTLTVLAETYTAGQILQVSCSTDGVLPAPLLSDTNYFVVSPSGNSFQLALTSGGAAITLTTTGSGLLFTGRVPEEIRQAILMAVVDLIHNRGDVSIGTLQRMQDLLNLSGYGSYA